MIRLNTWNATGAPKNIKRSYLIIYISVNIAIHPLLIRWAFKDDQLISKPFLIVDQFHEYWWMELIHCPLFWGHTHLKTFEQSS